MKRRLAIFASGNGSNANVLMNYFSNHSQIEIALIVTNNPSAGVIDFAKDCNVEFCIFTNEQFVHGNEVLECLDNRKIDYIILSGFLRKIPDLIIKNFSNKIINIHPALLPKFGGRGMYGKYVHEAVFESGETETGITIHLVDNEFDHGEHIAQYSCAISEGDDVNGIAEKVRLLEHTYFAPEIEKHIVC